MPKGLVCWSAELQIIGLFSHNSSSMLSSSAASSLGNPGWRSRRSPPDRAPVLLPTCSPRSPPPIGASRSNRGPNLPWDWSDEAVDCLKCSLLSRNLAEISCSGNGGSARSRSQDSAAKGVSWFEWVAPCSAPLRAMAPRAAVMPAASHPKNLGVLWTWPRTSWLGDRLESLPSGMLWLE